MRKMQMSRKASYSLRGFTLAESNVLKNIPLKMPYMQNLIKDRAKLARQAITENWSTLKYQKAISQLYDVRGWKFRGEPYNSSAVYKMVRDYQKDWQNTASDSEKDKWVSPSSKNKSHHSSNINSEKLRKQKQKYNNRPEVKLKRAKYRREHRAEIAEAERKRRKFNKGIGR
jgi:hypothetical protein